MNLKATLFSIFSFSLFIFGFWIVMLFNIDPLQDNFNQIAFLASLFIWLAGAITLTEYFIRAKIANVGYLPAYLPVSTRHGIIISTTIVTLLSLQLLRVLNIFDAILIIGILTSSELYFKARSHA
jgi:hypothetical protein